MARFGWRKDSQDDRDHLFSVVHHPHIAELPSKVDLSAGMPPVWDQGQRGSCVAHGTLEVFAYIHKGFAGSRLQLYYETRKLEGTVGQDAGAEIRDAVKVLASMGVAPETDWPYDISRFSEEPPAKATQDAAAHKVVSYSRLLTGDDFRQCLAAGFPFVIGAELFESFEGAKVAETGCVPLPDYDEKIIGGHCFAVIGYDDHSPIGSAFLCRNSWSESWGLKGDFWLPDGYMDHDDLASDAWTLRA